jgi:nucleosome binding factor SPN SPT16 subunit
LTENELHNNLKSWFTASLPSVEKIDITLFFEKATMIKSSSEVTDMKDCGTVVSKIFKKIVDEIETIIDQETSRTHLEISEEISKVLEDPKTLKKFIGEKMDSQFLENPDKIVIQSGGNFDLWFNASPDTNKLSADTILITVPMKYKDLCCLTSRTLMIDPDEKQKQAYQALHEAYAQTLKALIVGNTLESVFTTVQTYVQEHHPAFTELLPWTLGYGIGLYMKEDYLSIKMGNTETIQVGMCFVLRLHFKGFHSKKERDSLLIAETIIIGSDNNIFHCVKSQIQQQDITYKISESTEEEDLDKEEVLKGGVGNVLESRLRER